MSGNEAPVVLVGRGLASLFMAVAIGAAIGVAIGIALELAQAGDQRRLRAAQRWMTSRVDSHTLQELPQRLDSVWQRVTERWTEALAAGKEAAEQAEEDIKRLYRQTVQRPPRRRR